MIDYHPLEEVIHHPGLRLVLVRGMPSPWGQAAKTIFEIKGLEFVVGPQEAGGENEQLKAWSGQTSGPVVAWSDEAPIHRWIDILMLAERLRPTPSLIPTDAMQRALMIGLCHEVCGELGIGWNRRLQMFAPAIASGDPPAGMKRMAQQYGSYRPDQAADAGARTARILRALNAQLKSQQARGVNFFVGDALTALDLYWVAFMNMIDPLPAEHCPIPEDRRAWFVATDPLIRDALTPELVEHRGRIFSTCFRDPMEL
ncbi:hypothetical protein [Panacagrimonas sp.]|uniref:hypothetical protein n=1 Tax=Panacagrimonas sp. TaxID=2480088 RepID=UPI003B51CB36